MLAACYINNKHNKCWIVKKREPGYTDKIMQYSVYIMLTKTPS